MPPPDPHPSPAVKARKLQSASQHTVSGKMGAAPTQGQHSNLGKTISILMSRKPPPVHSSHTAHRGQSQGRGPAQDTLPPWPDGNRGARNGEDGEIGGDRAR